MPNVDVIGVPLDPDERESVVRIKNDPVARSELRFHEPYSALVDKLKFDKKTHGNFPVEPWLTSFPSEEELFMCTVENFVAFIDSDGCWEYTELVRRYMEEKIGDNRSLMLAVDHSVACASMIRASEIYGKDDYGLIIFDSHFDGILPTHRCDLIQYDLEMNPDTRFSRDDPFLYNRGESFNADSFLFKMIDENYINPENVIVVGVSDYPSTISNIDDERISRFVDFYHSYEEKGIKIITKDKLRANKKFFDPSMLETKNIHVSMDIDVGSRNAIYGARFIDYKGLSSNEIFYLLQKILDTKKRIVSADICEIDVWKAGKKFFGKQDRTYEVAAKIANMLF